MIIGIDGNEANVENSVGVSVYTLELLNYFAHKATKDTQFIVYLRSAKLKHLPKQTEFYRYVVIPTPRLWRDVHFPWYLFTHREIDVLFSPAHYTPRFCPVPVVVAIHDVAYEYFPHEFLKKDLYKLRNWTRHGLKQARAVISVSDSTSKDIRKFYKTPKHKITTVMNGFRTFSNVAKKYTTKEVLQKYKLVKDDYVLYVGTLQPRKNITTLIHAFQKVHKLRPHMHLVIAGKKGWLYDEFFAITKDLDIGHVVHFPGYVPDEEVVHLYRGAGAFVLPALYEGFGITVAEAMYQGSPVISSNSSSLPEVGGNAALYVNPQNETELRDAILKVMGNDSLRARMVKKGKEHVKQFSFERMAAETLAVIEGAILKA